MKALVQRYMKSQLTKSKIALLERVGRSRLRKKTIKMPDGCGLSALYGTPKALHQQNIKAVILVHGFAAEKTENGLFWETANQLVSAGQITLAYDWRGLGS